MDLTAERLIDSEGRDVELRPQAFAVLRHLICHAGRVVSREELISVVWIHAVVTSDSLVQAIGDIRRALNDEKHETIHTVRGRGYIIYINEIDNSLVDPVVVDKSKQVSNSSRLPTIDVRSFPLILISVFAAVGLAVLLLLRFPTNVVSLPTTVPVVAVMPFTELGAATYSNAIADSFTADLIAELARSHGLRVVAPLASVASSNSVLTDKQIGRELGANYLLRGHILTGVDRLRVKLQLIEAESSQIVLSISSQRETARISVQTELMAVEIATSVESGLLHSELIRVMRPGINEFDAYTLSTRIIARMHTFAPEGYRIARREANEAMTLDPNYAPTFVNLAYLDFFDALNAITGKYTMKDINLIEQTLHRGMAIDSEIPRAWQLLSQIRTAQDRPQEAHVAANRAVRLAPNDPDSLMVLAIAQISLGQISDAAENMEHARNAYPIAPSYFLSYYARTRWAAGDYLGAVSAADECLLQSPKHKVCWVEKIIAQADAGQVDEALATANRMRAEHIQADFAQFSRGFASKQTMLALRLTATERVGIGSSMD